VRVAVIAYLIQHGGADRVARWLKVPARAAGVIVDGAPRSPE
jgi:hypothetical protein